MSSSTTIPATPATLTTTTPEGDALRTARDLLDKAATAADAGNPEVAYFLSARAFDVAGDSRERIRATVNVKQLGATLKAAAELGEGDPAAIQARANAFVASGAK